MLVIKFLVLAFICATAFSPHGPKSTFKNAEDPWQKLSRSTKLNNLWQALTNDTQSLPYPGIFEQSQLFLESMDLTFNTASDRMPQQYIGNLFEREKLIHTIGAMAQAKLVFNNSRGYTGLFATGCDSALLRFSLATKPDKLSAPGLAIKCLRDGIPSGNLFAMYALDGQSSFNFFEHDLTNHVPAPSKSWRTAALIALDIKFRTASSWPTMMGLSNAARFNQKGVNETSINFPYRLIFHPNSVVRASFPSASTGRTMIQEIMYRLKPGILYDIYAQDHPLQDNSKLVKIGYVEVTSKATTSYYGDRHYFHQHTAFENDLYFKPEWEQGASEDIAMQTNPDGPRFRYGDLPF